MNKELLENSVRQIITICDEIYCHVDRNPRGQVSDVDFELVKTFNKLSEINQRNLDTLYPERKKVTPPRLCFYETPEDKTSIGLAIDVMKGANQ